MDFSCFDWAVAPVVIASPQWKIVYTNRSAQRRFPFFTTEDVLISRYESSELKSAFDTLKNGGSCTLLYDEEPRLSLVFSPYFEKDGSLEYICVNVSSDEETLRELFPTLTDNELIREMRRELIPSTHVMTQQVRIAEKFALGGNTESLIHTLRIFRLKLIRQTLFCARMSECIADRTKEYSFCDVNSALCACLKRFEKVRYKPVSAVYVPLARESLILMIVDILSNLKYRQTTPSITVSVSSSQEGVTVKFASGPLDIPLNVPCEDDFQGIDMGSFSVRRRMEFVDGQVSVKRRTRGGVAISLQFPHVRGVLDDSYFNDYAAREPSALEQYALEFLDIISSEN